MAFIWGEATRFIVTLLAALLGLIAVLMIPGERRIREGRAGGYMRSGRWLVLILGLLILGAALGLGYEWLRLRQRDLWVTGNLLLLTLLGIGVLAGNFRTMRLIKMRTEGEVIEVEAVEVEAGEVLNARPSSAQARCAGMEDDEAAQSGSARQSGGRAEGGGAEAPAAGDASSACESPLEGEPGGLYTRESH
ncbi:MAG: hypothetical protein QXH42_08120 [Thermoplasmata archaeon]